MQKLAIYAALTCAAAFTAASVLPELVSLIVFGDLGRALSVTLAAAAGAVGLALGCAAGRAHPRKG